MRALVDFEEKQIRELDRLARKRKASRAAVIRAAVSDYLGKHMQDDAQSAFGLWSEHKVDGLEYQEKIRSEW